MNWCPSPLESASRRVAAGAGCDDLDALSSGGVSHPQTPGVEGFPLRRRSSLPGAAPVADGRSGSPGLGVRPRLHPVVAAGAFTAAVAACFAGRFVLASILLVAAAAEAVWRS